MDGYVWLPSPVRPGLGAYLYEALGRCAPAVGMAKTAFARAHSCHTVAQVFRGDSRSPLFVTAVGVESDVAVQRVHQMAGKHRIPEMMRIADRLSKSTASAGERTA